MRPKHGKTWKPRLSQKAQRDYANISEWTEETFGARQADLYAALIDAALDRLEADPFAAPSRNRDEELGGGYWTIHISRPGRHIMVYRVEGEHVVIVRILHDSMDIARHLPPGDE